MICTVLYRDAFFYRNRTSIFSWRATYTAIENSPTVRTIIAKYREFKETLSSSSVPAYYPSADIFRWDKGYETTYANNATSENIDLTRREFNVALISLFFNGFFE